MLAGSREVPALQLAPVNRVRETLFVLASCMAQWECGEDEASSSVHITQTPGYGTHHFIAHLLDFIQNDDTHSLATPKSVARILADMQSGGLLLDRVAPSADAIAAARKSGESLVLAALRATFPAKLSFWIDGLASDPLVLRVHINGSPTFEPTIRETMDADICRAVRHLVGAEHSIGVPKKAVSIFGSFLSYCRRPLILIVDGVYESAWHKNSTVYGCYMNELIALAGLFFLIPEPCLCRNLKQAAPIIVLTRPLSHADIGAILALTTIIDSDGAYQPLEQMLGIAATKHKALFVRSLLRDSGGRGRLVRVFLEHCLERQVRGPAALERALAAFGEFLLGPNAPRGLLPTREHLLFSPWRVDQEQRFPGDAAAVIFWIISKYKVAFRCRLFGKVDQYEESARNFGCACIPNSWGDYGSITTGDWTFKAILNIAAADNATWLQLSKIHRALSTSTFQCTPKQIAIAEHLLSLAAESPRVSWAAAFPSLAETCVAQDAVGAETLALVKDPAAAVDKLQVGAVCLTDTQQGSFHEVIVRTSSAFIGFTQVHNPEASWEDVKQKLQQCPAALSVSYVLIALVHNSCSLANMSTVGVQFVHIPAGRWNFSTKSQRIPALESDECSIVVPRNVEVVLTFAQEFVNTKSKYGEIFWYEPDNRERYFYV
jgi:hypothetical protein